MTPTKSGMSGKPSDYENRAREQIGEWKKPDQGWFGQTMRQIGWPVDRVRALIGKAAAATGLHDVLAKALAGTLHVLGDAAAWAVRRDAVYVEFREKGHDVHRHADVFKLDLEQVDAVVGRLDAKYTGLAFAEGAAAGAAGVPGLIAEVLPLLSVGEMTLRLYGAFNYSQNSARDLRCALNGA